MAVLYEDSLMRRFFCLLAAPLVAGCAEVVVDDGPIVCLHFTDPERSVPNGPVPEGLSCAVEPSLERRLSGAGQAPEVTPRSSEWDRKLVCTSESSDGTCPDAATAAGAFNQCLASRQGEGCDHPISGYCETRYVWSACGPDPSAVGGCCYEVFVARDGYWT